MVNDLLKIKDEILDRWIEEIDIDLDKNELRYQFSKLFDALIAYLNKEEVDIESFVESMSKYEVSARDISEALLRLLDILEDKVKKDDLLLLTKAIYSVIIYVYDEFEKEKDELISRQLVTIKKMEIPILRLNKDTLLIPLIGFIDSEKALTLMRQILETIRREKTLKVIIDIEGVPVIDTEVANQFIRIYRGIKAIGARLIMSGITPAVAETMVHLDIDLPIPTRANLELAIKAFEDEEI